MGPTEFARALREMRDASLALYTSDPGATAVAADLAAAKLSPEQAALVEAALRRALTDTLYTLLLALDGCAALGGKQQSYTLHDEDGNLIANGNGDLEAAAYEALHGDDLPKRQ